MALVVRKIYEFYNYHFNENTGEFVVDLKNWTAVIFKSFVDERIKDLFLVESVWPIMIIVGSYMFFVNGFGQKMMKNRPAFELTTLINFYNISQVFLNLLFGIGVRFE